MNKRLILSGYDLVAKGITKNQATLPELGLKDVIPNGSWLEAKQIQSAIDARKQLIAAERIEKNGMLSCAEWRENLMLAEVIQKSGGYWQYMGHNVEKKMFLYPEEALFLIEINSLLLRYNDVKVSLQQAYSLLLRDKDSLIQYKVYASLSRWGYKVFRHKDPMSDICNVDEMRETLKSEEESYNSLTKNTVEDMDIENQSDGILDYNGVEGCNIKTQFLSVDDDSDDLQSNGIGDYIKCKESKIKKQKNIYQYKIEKHKNRQFKPCKTNNLQKFFENLPNLLNTEVVTVKVPEKSLIPNNITFTEATYTLSLNVVRTKDLRALSPQSRTSSSTEVVNRSNLRTFRGNYRHQIPPFVNYTPNNDSSNNIQFRPYNCWSSFVRANYYHFNMPFQRPLLGNFLFTPRFQCHPRLQQFNRPRYNFNRPYYRRQIKRQCDNTKHLHFESLKKLAARLKNLVLSRQTHTEPLAALNNLIQSYNSRYGSTIKLSEDYEIVENENILDTIELDDDGEQKKKKPRLDSNTDTYTINLNNIKQVAERLRKLENDNKSSPRHRRAFSNLIKTFNKSYNAEIYLSNNFKVLDKSLITLESSSDSDCMIDENSNSSGKKVRNPFNIFKRLSEKRNKSLDAPGTSRDSANEKFGDDYREVMKKNLSKEWIPNDNDFGRPEIVFDANKSNTAHLFYEFMKFHPENYENWLDLKVSFLSSLEETADFFSQKNDGENLQNRSLVSPEDCVDIVSVLKKISIIQSHNTTSETSLRIDFDVYNRDVQHFRKTDPPVPHFRISCLDESAKFPSGEEIASLHAKYKDEVRLVFAIVGNGTMNFVQIDPFSLPTHISSNVT